MLNVYHKEEWTFFRYQKDKIYMKCDEHKDWQTFKSFWRKTQKTKALNKKNKKRWVFKIKMINGSLPILTKRYRDQGDVYNSSNCHKCVVNEETSDHLAACPVDKETWK